jgi:acyl carrier protein
MQEVTTSIPVPAAPELLEDLRQVCAETIEIPVDKVTVQADLAADLGVDSLTMDELMVLVLTRYGLPAKSVQATSYPTISALADLILELSAAEDDGKNTRPDA